MADIADLEFPLLEETKRSLERIQSFNPESLIRRDILGINAFDDAVAAAKRIIDLFAILPVGHLVHFPDDQLVQIRDTANNAFRNFEDILNFNVDSALPNVPQARDTLIQSLRNVFQPTFNVLSPLIAFSTARAQDFSAMEREARAAVKAAMDQVATLVQGLDGDKKQ